ncbi:MAG: SDR family oxidoreductase [SAR202 cluster bacterium]|nr:SDR family oxidoreductase [SAR202 cluster bacterium]
MFGDLKGKVAIVTGGASGIGRGICLVLEQQGATVVSADLNLKGAEAVASEITERGGKAAGFEIDVTKRESVERVVAKVVRQWGQVDIMVNDAGVIGGAKWWERGDTNDDDWQHTFDVNVRGVVLATEAAADHMKKRRYGKVVNIASIAALRGGPEYPHYNASKAAVVSYTKSAAIRLAPFSINVNAICPGLLWTPMWEKILYRRTRHGLDESLRGLTERQVFERIVEMTVPLKREQTPEDIGNLTAFLVSEEAKNITGQAMIVDGGRTSV